MYSLQNVELRSQLETQTRLIEQRDLLLVKVTSWLRSQALAFNTCPYSHAILLFYTGS